MRMTNENWSGILYRKQTFAIANPSRDIKVRQIGTIFSRDYTRYGTTQQMCAMPPEIFGTRVPDDTRAFDGNFMPSRADTQLHTR